MPNVIHPACGSTYSPRVSEVSSSAKKRFAQQRAEFVVRVGALPYRVLLRPGEHSGCVGRAGNKNSHGLLPSGSDANGGYECDNGIGQSNPAHIACGSTTPPHTWQARDELRSADPGTPAPQHAEHLPAARNDRALPGDASDRGRAIGSSRSPWCSSAQGGPPSSRGARSNCSQAWRWISSRSRSTSSLCSSASGEGGEYDCTSLSYR